MSIVSVDTDKLPGKFSKVFVNPDHLNQVANLGVSIGEFLGGNVPSHVLVQDLVKVLELVAEVPDPVTSEEESNDDGIGTGETGGVTPV